MLETRFKIALLVVVAIFASFPIMGILRGTSLPPVEPDLPQVPDVATNAATGDDSPVDEVMVTIPAGPFTRGTTAGGYDEQPVRSIHLDAYSIDKYEVTNHHYAAFVAATGHRKAGPPSRYAKNMARMRGANQPVVYVSWEDAEAYCRWKGKRLPTEAEWEKAMRGTDARLWPWGNDVDPLASNWAVARDGYDVAAPVGSFKRDVSPFGVADGAGNVLEWVADWYGEDVYRDATGANPKGPEFGTFKVLRGGGYTTSGTDVRVTSRSKMVPDFRDETIGFRCAVSGAQGGDRAVRTKGRKVTENQSSRE
ncbi:MAG: formylglycine-generating enzyme family protein [Nitrospiraceae bacterium]